MSLANNRSASGVLVLAVACFGSSILRPAIADTVTGQVNATMTLVDGCLVNGLGDAVNVNFGALDFGSQSTLFTTADGEVVANGGAGVAVQCTDGTDFTIKVVSGSNDANSGSATHALASGGKFIPYNLYTAATRTAGEILNNSDLISVSADGTVQAVNLFSRAFGAVGLDAGVYTDVLSLELEF